MTLEKTLSLPWNIIKKQPKVIIPIFLLLIPEVLLISILSGVLEDQYISSWISHPENFTFPYQKIVIYGVYFLLVLVIFFLVNTLVKVFYQEVVFEKNKSLKNLLKKSYSSFWKMLWTDIIKDIILLLLFISSIGFLLLGFLLKSFFALWIVLFALAIILFILVAILLYPLPAIVVKEKASGLKAIKRSIKFSKRNFLDLAILLFIIGIITQIVSRILSPIPSIKSPYTKTLLESTVWLLIGVYLQMLPASFYITHKRGKK